MLLVHKIKLEPNNKQATYFKKSAGVARFAYNWALAEWKKQYAQGEKPNETKLRRQINAIKAIEFPWMQEVTKVATQQAIKNLGAAFNRFFKGAGKYPRFKKKGVHDAFRADNGPSKQGENAVKIQNQKIQLPKIGWVKLAEELRYAGQIKSVTISRRANCWYAAILFETNQLIHIRKNHAIVGVDLGIKTFVQLSSGQAYTGANAHSRKLKRLKRLSRQLSAKQKGSSNFIKAKLRLAKLHAQITDIRQDALHKITTDIVLNCGKICLEDLNVSGMIKNRKLSRAIMDQSFSEFRRQLEYKAKLYQSEIIIADRYFASSKICNCCKTKNDYLELQVRNWICAECGAHHDRDLNAALNLKNYILENHTASSAGIYACGVEGSGAVEINSVKPCHVEARIQH